MNNQANSNQPNESDTQSDVSNDPSTRLPEVTKGQINTICNNPEIERKRRVNHYQAMSGNTFALKTGRYAKLHPTPEYLLNYLEYIDELQFDQPKEVIEVMVRIVKSNLKRITLKEYLELSEGDIGDKRLTAMLKDTFTMTQAIGQFMTNHQSEVNNQPFSYQEIKNLTDDERNSALLVVRTALQRLREGKKDLVVLPS